MPTNKSTSKPATKLGVKQTAKSIAAKSAKTSVKPVAKVNSKVSSRLAPKASSPVTKATSPSPEKPLVKKVAPGKITISKIENKRIGKPALGSGAKSKSTKQPAKSSPRQGALDVFHKVSTQTANEEMNLLCQHYPEADCELDFETPFQLITAVIMSAQTTDVNVNKVTKNLYLKYPDAKALAEAPLDDIKDIIRSTGFFNAKATNIQNCAAMLVEKFGGEVPKTIEELITLPGVGRKTANVVLGVCFGVPGWTVDTHVQRLSKRLGFTNEEDPEKIEYTLQKIFPAKDWSKLSITLIWHGRRICFARKPDCESCPINHLCPSSLAP